MIVPVYNVAAYLRQCVDSILNQTYQDIEILLINDRSTDTSEQICLDYQQHDSRVRVIDAGLQDTVIFQEIDNFLKLTTD